MRRDKDALVLSSIDITPEMVALSDDGKAATSVIQVAKVGSFTSKRYGRFQITEAHVDQMIENQKAIINEPPVDYHHLSMGAQVPDQTLAAGWFTDLEKREDKSLWGTINWTPKAAKHIRHKELKYLSPVILFDGQTDTNEHVGAVLYSAALTNYPFLKGMAPVSLSDLQAQGILLTDMSLDEKRSRLSAALNEKWKNSPSWVWLKDVFDEFVVYEKDGKLFRQDYTVGDSWSITFDGEPKEVAVQYAALSSQEEITMPEQRTPAAEPNPDVVKLQSDFSELSGKLTQLTADLTAQQTENANLRKKLATQEAENAVGALIRSGKAVPAMKDKLVELHMKDPVMFVELTATMPKIVEVGKIHGTGEGDEAANNEIGGDPIKLFDDKVAEFVAANPTVKFSDAMSIVAKKNPGMYEARRAAYSRQTAVNSGTESVN